MNDCLFCKIIAGDIPSHRVYEDDQVIAFLDINPVSRGHTLFVPKEHAENLDAGTIDTACALMKAIHTSVPGFLRNLGGSGYNLGMNQGADAGQIVFHTHLHVMPRYAGAARTFVKTHPIQEELAETARIMQGLG